MKSLFDDNIQLTAKVLDLRLMRQNIVVSNLANIKTPGYRARRLEFEEKLQAALDLEKNNKITRTNEKHLPVRFNPQKFGPDFFKDFEPRVVQGEDRVDLDKEMAIMAKNTMLYNALTQVLRKNFEGLKLVISEGGK
ncbi:flagellar basal body rod protein FlgB [Desulfohalobiaceae bacterium Ax17]|uniref:flagellar basal body rod protein FlgB n=1 Tax=Desulfovulcanus ferrireducens TaxID=2831190 RepID=UPI00207B9EA6|nr:flagellar basal body rod protein FlgB [Desulfovulcanus ferrireducens]MBT8764279.1 flagellar basal body rod protein FlgB [Desulfovulcanus ferrireducens]